MKKLGLCSLALSGVLALAGCTTTDDANEKIDEIAEKLEELEGKYENQEVVDFDYAYGLFSLAQYSYSHNFQGYRDNLVMTINRAIEGTEVSIENYFYKDDSNNYHYVQIVSDGEIRVIYETSDAVYSVSKTNQGVVTKTNTELDSTELALITTRGEFLDVLGDANESKNSLTKVEKLENGNLSLTFVEEEGAVFGMRIFEITTDGKIISSKSSFSGLINGTVESFMEEITLSYGNANDTTFQEKLAWAEAQEVTE